MQGAASRVREVGGAAADAARGARPRLRSPRRAPARGGAGQPRPRTRHAGGGDPRRRAGADGDGRRVRRRGAARRWRCTSPTSRWRFTSRPARRSPTACARGWWACSSSASASASTRRARWCCTPPSCRPPPRTTSPACNSSRCRCAAPRACSPCCPSALSARTRARALLLRELAAHLGLVLDNARLAQRLRELSMVDGLTRLLNRRTVHQRLGEEWERARRYGGALSVLLCRPRPLQAGQRHLRPPRRRRRARRGGRRAAPAGAHRRRHRPLRR